MRVEYKACIPQYEATQHQDIQETHWGMHADNPKHWKIWGDKEFTLIKACVQYLYPLKNVPDKSFQNLGYGPEPLPPFGPKSQVLVF